MRFISWNVNGLRACVGKGFEEFFTTADADVVAIQETKLQIGQIDLSFEGYESYFNSAVKKGYSGTAVYTRVKPISVAFDFPEEGELYFFGEGRVITLEFEEYYFVNVYTPNAQRELTRLPFRMEWEDAFRAYLLKLDEKKPVIICGDLNVAHQEIDIKNAKSNRGNAGFTDEEREKFTVLLESGFVDSFRHLYPDRKDAYTWWSYMGNARAKNVGWRIDYFVVSKSIADRVKESAICPEVYGSDHCPVMLEID
ncbi:MAG TPA: exodeoxyribonuclease III [Clostridia bacterium]|nr:exodeoxyribonuclease III [Clostridia bacterium]